MKEFRWSAEKNAMLRRERGISFEQIIFHIQNGDLLAVVAHPNPDRYAGQHLYIVNIDGYCWLVPYVEDEHTVFLKTAMPSRRATRRYLGRRPK